MIGVEIFREITWLDLLATSRLSLLACKYCPTRVQLPDSLVDLPWCFPRRDLSSNKLGGGLQESLFQGSMQLL